MPPAPGPPQGRLGTWAGGAGGGGEGGSTCPGVCACGATVRPGGRPAGADAAERSGTWDVGRGGGGGGAHSSSPPSDGACCTGVLPVYCAMPSGRPAHGTVFCTEQRLCAVREGGGGGAEAQTQVSVPSLNSASDCGAPPMTFAFSLRTFVLVCGGGGGGGGRW